MSSIEKERAERLFRQQQDAPKALAEYRAKQEATHKLTAKLRAERLAREAVHGKPNRVEKELRKVESTNSRGVAENQKSKRASGNASV